MPSFAIPLQTGIPIDDAHIEETLERLRRHREFLEEARVPPISELGTLSISATVLATGGRAYLPPGTTIPEPSSGPHLPGPQKASAPPISLPQGEALRPVSAAILEAMTNEGEVTARQELVAASPPENSVVLDLTSAASPAGAPPQNLTSPQQAAAPPTLLNVAYFAAQKIVLADNATVILQYPHQYLTFIAEELVVGSNVTFTWEMPSPKSWPTSYPEDQRPPKLTDLRLPLPNQRQDGLSGVHGRDGSKNPQNGADAPEVEMWVVSMTGSPMFVLNGQDGGAGGRGEDGGDAGDGVNGFPERWDPFRGCLQAASPGGYGGTGGDGGAGGDGSNGGNGGRITLYAPREVLETYTANGFNISANGGRAGPPGGSGTPGRPGKPGVPGLHPHNCRPVPTDAKLGSSGKRKSEGNYGAAGLKWPDAARLLPIKIADFREQLTRPALVLADPIAGIAGTEVRLTTLRVQPTDRLLIDDVEATTHTDSDTQLRFVVPEDARGGRRTLQIRQQDGTLSNKMTFQVLPHVSGVGKADRQRPGTTVTVHGSGFTESSIVRVNGEDMPDVAFVSASQLTFTLRRPAATPSDESGESGRLVVILPDGEPSNEVEFIIETFRMVVLGDSVAWGQGLLPSQKFSTIVADGIAADNDGMRTYTTMLAHSGATIGIGDKTWMPPINGEIPTAYPTVMQQLDMVPGDPASVDIILVTAGLNDVNFRTVVDPRNQPATFAAAISQHCHRDLRALLTAAANKFPNATIVATGYYPMVSDASEDAGLKGFLITAANVFGGPLGAVLTALGVSQVVTNCRAFHELSTLAIRSAVEDVNDRMGGFRVRFADPGFKPENAALAPRAWLYGIGPDGSPLDESTRSGRAAVCALNRDRADEFQCVRASVGHPNVKGARAYAQAITAALTSGNTDASDRLPSFPEGFLFGVATAAMQNEGGITGNDWYAFATSPAIKKRVQKITEIGGRAASLVPPGDATRHADLNVLGADLDRAASLGINALRFSVEWSRLCPKRPHQGGDLTDADFDASALSYYGRVLDLLAARSMTPVLSLNHLTLPKWALDPPREGTLSPTSVKGVERPSADDPNFTASMRGWGNLDVVEEYVRLVKYLARRWKDRIDWWVTINEPVGSMTAAGYIAGVWPPGFVFDAGRAKTAYFNLIKAHLRAYEAIKSITPAAQVGFAHYMTYAKTTYEFADDINDQDAARNQFDYFINWHMLNAVVTGQFDNNIQRRAKDRDVMSGPGLRKWAGLGDEGRAWVPHCDFVGVNYYRSVYLMGWDPILRPVAPPDWMGGQFHNNLATSPQVHQLLTPLGWEMCPEGFGKLLREVHGRYKLPVMVTENGTSQVIDTTRGPYLTAHLTELLSAVADGVQVVGYMYWTLVDNWEWHEGYTPEAQFGLFTLRRDTPGQERRLTEGAMAYAYATRTRSVRGMRQWFGAVSAGGDQVRPPLRSPSYLTGTVGADAVELSLRAAPDRKLLGLLWTADGSDRLLLPVEGRFDAKSRKLRLRHPAFGSTPAGALLADAAPDGLTLKGNLTRQDHVLPVALTQDRIVGQWAGGDPLIRLQITRAPGGTGYVGAWFRDELPRGWVSMSVQRVGDQVFALKSGMLVDGQVTMTGDKLAGDLVLHPPFSGSANDRQVKWRATRVPGGPGLGDLA